MIVNSSELEKFPWQNEKIKKFFKFLWNMSTEPHKLWQSIYNRINLLLRAREIIRIDTIGLVLIKKSFSARRDICCPEQLDS